MTIPPIKYLLFGSDYTYLVLVPDHAVTDFQLVKMDEGCKNMRIYDYSNLKNYFYEIRGNSMNLNTLCNLIISDTWDDPNNRVIDLTLIKWLNLT